MTIPILASDPVAPSGEPRSTVSVHSDAIAAAAPGQSSYVAGLMPVNLDQYCNNLSVVASQEDSEGSTWFECLAPAPFYNRDPVPIAYCVTPGINVCIWCNHGIDIDNERRKMWCVGNGGHEVWRSEMDLEENTFCNACEVTIR
ncbi:hypothetical protein EJ02DRAFT_195464 [Clathrospora elynae]|uniref:Uncharacterized protein n=1 Tax=Clathrospora elynae TaxID=706981 RepID=A0A6A5SLX7_9PLEO|nr:hypothetical protein EJ02DRAFT_195464 [Clathrospora elynae]